MELTQIESSRLPKAVQSRLVLFLCGALLLIGALAPRPAAAQAGENVDYQSPVGIPSGAATMAMPWIIKLTLPPAVQGGAPQFQTITIDNLPAIMAGETFAAASKRKADAVAAAVNAKLGAGRATVVQKKTRVQTGVRIRKTPFGPVLVPVYQTVNLSYVKITGLYTIPDKKGKPGSGTPSVVFKTNPTLEFGDGGRNQPGIGTKMPSPGETTGSLGGTGSSFASGQDTSGGQSFVSFGETGGFLASVQPTSGESDSQVLTDLSSLLTSNGVANVFDSSSDTLFLTPPDGYHGGFDYSDTDTGLDLAFAVTGASIPEPQAWMLMIAGLGLAGATVRRRRVLRARTAASDVDC